MPYCQVLGTRTYYEVDGPEGAQPIMLFHGAHQDTLSWRFNSPALSKKYRVYAIDLAGHGKSAKLNGKPIFKTDIHAEFVWALIETLGIQKPIVAGHSMSGGLVLMLGTQHSERLKAIVVVNGAADTGRIYHSDILDMTQVSSSVWSEVGFMALAGRDTPRELMIELTMDSRRCPQEVGRGDSRCYGTLRIGDQLHKIRVPVLFIQGEDDWSLTPEMSKASCDAIQNAPTEYRLMKRVGHFPHTERPDLFNPILLGLLEQFQL